MGGENVCIFAYGQTGSGKTYTMEGPGAGQLFDQATGQLLAHSGILPRTAHLLAAEIQRMKEHLDKPVDIEVSSLEIYCEIIRDLLSPNGLQSKPSLDPTSKRGKLLAKQDTAEGLQIVANGQQVILQGQTWVKVPAGPDFVPKFLDQIRKASERRVFKDNGKNDHSSRGHHVFQIKIKTTGKTGRPQESLLNIVDLAGSERREKPYAAESIDP